MVAFVETLIWMTLSLVSLVLAKRSRRSRSRIPRWGTVLLLTVDVAAVAIALRNSGAMPSKYPMVVGSSLLVLGWAISHGQLLLAPHAQAPLARRAVRFTYRLLGPQSRQVHSALLGDWVQLVGLELVWTSIYGLLFALTVIPIAVHLVTRGQLMRTAGVEDIVKFCYRLLSVLWASFHFLCRITFIAVLPAALVALLTRDIVVFRGTSQEAATLLATLAQVEATVGALVVTLLFVVVELTTSAYSPRLSRLLSTRLSFRGMIALAVLSLVLKFSVLSNIHWMRLPGSGGESLLIDGVLLGSVLAVLGYVTFARDAFALMSPEAIVLEALKGFDSDWMQTVRHEWSSRVGPRSMHIARDPMVLVERILVSALHRGDINTFQAGLILTRDSVEAGCGPHDGAVIDSYLSDRLASVVRVAAERQADVELQFLSDIMDDITTPSPEALHSADLKTFDPPLGSKLLRLVTEHAMASHLPNSAVRAIYLIERRAAHAVKALPMLSDLWLFNREKMCREISESEKETLWRNHWRLENYVHGYLDYLGRLGAKAIDADMAEVSAAASHSLSQQVGTFLKHIQEESYQRFLLLHAFGNLGEIVKGACTKRIVGAARFGVMSLTLDTVSHANVAMTISDSLSDFITRMATAGILDLMTVIDTAVAALGMAENNPQAVLPILEAFGQAGESLQALDDFPRREDLKYVMEEILGRIDQVERAGLQAGIKAKVRRAASRARRRAKRRTATNH